MVNIAHHEQELKYRLTEAQHTSLLNADVFVSSSAWVDERLCSRYYDTTDYRLAATRIALRLRLQDGHTFFLTCKSGGTQHGALHQRKEEEIPIVLNSADIFWPDLANRLPWKKLESYPQIALIKQEEPLVELFVTDFTRRHTLLPWQGSMLDIAFDTGCIHAAACIYTIRELEVELQSGFVEDLLAFDVVLRQSYDLQPEGLSKFQRGMELLGQSTKK